MTRAQLFDNIKKKSSYLCVGLDTDLSKIPKHLLSNDDPVFEFNKQIIDATHEYAVAYKPNIAFYEALGPQDGSACNEHLNTFHQIFLPLPMQNEATSVTRPRYMQRLFLKRWILIP